MVVLINL